MSAPIPTPTPTPIAVVFVDCGAELGDGVLVDVAATEADIVVLDDSESAAFPVVDAVMLVLPLEIVAVDTGRLVMETPAASEKTAVASSQSQPEYP